jgi:hypothetical protein
MLSCYQTLSLVPFLVAAGFLLESVTAAAADPTVVPVAQGSFGGHYYEVIKQTSAMYGTDAATGAAARSACGVQGTLASVETTDGDEASFVIGLASSFGMYMWLADCYYLTNAGDIDSGTFCASSMNGYIVEYPTDCPAAAGDAPVIDWSIEPDTTSPGAVDISFSQARLNDEIIFKYNAPDPSTVGVSYTVTKHAFADCEALVDQQADPILDLSVLPSSFSTGVLTVPIDVVQSQIELADATSDVYNVETGIVSFCLKVQFFYNDVEATFHNTKVSFTLNFDEQFTASAITVTQIAASQDTGSTIDVDYLAEPFPCTQTFQAAASVTSYKQGTFC